MSTLPGFIGIVLTLSIACLVVRIGAHRLFKRNRQPVDGTTSVSRLLSEWRWLLWLLLMTDVFLISNHLLVRGLAVGIWDINAAYYPYQTLVADHARSGQFLLWDPWSSGGLPAGGDPQFGAFSPVNLAIGLVAGGTSTGFLTYWLLMWWLGGVGMMLLARHLKAPAWGGAVVALGFLFCGTYIGQAEHTSLISAFSLLPFVIWRLNVALSSGRLLPAVEAGALWGASALAGYPGMVIITALFAGLWALGRWLCRHDPWAGPPSDGRVAQEDGPRKPTIRLVVAAIGLVPLVGVLVLAPTYFTYFYEGSGTSTRVGALAREIAVSENALAPGAIASLSSPYLPILKFFSQTAVGKGLWSETDISGCGLYTGAVISAFALLALFNKPREKWRWWLLGIGLLNLGFAVGPALPLRGWLYDWFYPTRFFRHPTIFRAYLLFAIAVLALIGTRDLAAVLSSVRDHTRRRFLAAAILCSSGALGVFYYYVQSPAIERVSRAGEPFALWHAASVWAGICAVAIIAWVAPARVRPWCVPLLLLTLAASDAFMTTSISIGILADAFPASVKRWETLDKRHSSSLDLAPRGLLREEMALYRDGDFVLDITNDQMITKIPAFNTYATASNNYQMVMASDATMRRMAVGTDRIWFSKEAGRMAPSDANFALFRNRVQVLGSFPLLVHSSSEMLRIGAISTFLEADREVEITRLPAAAAVPVTLIKYVPNELSFEVQCASDGWLLVTDRWARSWHAEVNESPVEVYGGNFIFRAVQVSAGANRIRFKYQPRGFPWLVALSWGTLLVVSLASIRRATAKTRSTS